MSNFNRDGSRTVWITFALAACIVLAIRTSDAAQVEIGAGMAHAQTNGNGTWYQEGFARTLRLNSPVLEIGVTGRVRSWLRWHVDAVDLGRYASNAQAVPDANYDPASSTFCAGACMPTQDFVGDGRIAGVQALLSLHTRGAWQVGIEGGPFLYHESWRLDVPNWYLVPGQIIPIATYRARWAIGSVVGFTLSHGRWTLALSRYADGAGFGHHVGGWPPLWRGQTALTLNYRFGGTP